MRSNKKQKVEMLKRKLFYSLGCLFLNEFNNFFLVHKSEGTLPGGVHFEMTGSNVTECLGGANEVKESDLGSRYHTHCDPRLNGSQSLELAFLVSDLIKSFRNGKGS